MSQKNVPNLNLWTFLIQERQVCPQKDILSFAKGTYCNKAGIGIFISSNIWEENYNFPDISFLQSQQMCEGSASVIPHCLQSLLMYIKFCAFLFGCYEKINSSNRNPSILMSLWMFFVFYTVQFVYQAAELTIFFCCNSAHTLH